MYESLAARVTDALIDGLRTYIRRAEARRPRPSSPSARVVVHLHGLLADEDTLRQKVMAAITRVHGNPNDVAFAMVEVVMDLLGPLKADFLVCSLKGHSNGKVRAQCARAYAKLARDCEDPYFHYEEITDTEAKIRGMEESLADYSASCELEQHIADLRQGIVALLKRAILWCIQRGISDAHREFRMPKSSHPRVRKLLREAVMKHTWARKNPTVWLKAIEMRERNEKWSEIAGFVNREEQAIQGGAMAKSGSDLGSFDVLVKEVVMEILNIFLVLWRRNDEGEERDHG